MSNNIVRTTISVPLALKARMDAHEPPVNWSAVACRAFEAIVTVADEDDGSGPDMTIIAPDSTGTGTGVRLLDADDRRQLLRDLDAGRIVAIYSDATGANVAYVVCANAEAIHGVFVRCDENYSYAIKD